MALNKLNMQKAQLRKDEREVLQTIVELEFKVRMAERYINMMSYTKKRKDEREEQLATLQEALKEQRICLELIHDTRKELGIVEEDEKEESLEDRGAVDEAQGEFGGAEPAQG